MLFVESFIDSITHLKSFNHIFMRLLKNLGPLGNTLQSWVSLRKLSKNAFKRKIKQTLSEILASEDCYVDLPEIVQKGKLNLFCS